MRSSAAHVLSLANREISRFPSKKRPHRMTTADLVKFTTSLTDAKDIPACAKVRGEILGDVRPTFALHIVTGLIRPDVRVEVEIIAAAK
jgi:enamine deaminase RidA (YjgF/YER057c/UK114 family)